MGTIFIRSEESIGDVAETLREILNIPASNRRASVTQRREGVNRGGEYYKFEVLGLELLLLCNAGEVADDEHPSANYYLFDDSMSPQDDPIMQHLQRVLSVNGMDVEYDPTAD